MWGFPSPVYEGRRLTIPVTQWWISEPFQIYLPRCTQSEASSTIGSHEWSIMCAPRSQSETTRTPWFQSETAFTPWISRV